MNDAERLFFTGGAHARAAHALAHAAKSDVHMCVPFYLLVGFTLETLIKSAFLHYGGDIRDAKFKISHDLPKALAFAQQRGFHPSNDDLPWLTETMNEVHRHHAFRYLTGDDQLIVADVVHCLRIIDDLVVQVGRLLHPEHDQAFWIDRLKKFELPGA